MLRNQLRISTLPRLWRSLVMVAVGSASAAAADIRVVAPSAPGSGWDQVARAMQSALASGGSPTTIAIQNVPGGNGTVGLARFLSVPPDGDILVTGLTMLDAMLVKRAPVEFARMTPLARLCVEYYAIVVPTASPIQTLADLKTALQTEPSKISWAGGPLGGIDHAGAALLAIASGVAPVALNYVPFVTTGDAVAATVDGKVTSAFLSTVELDQAIKAEAVRVLAVAAPMRLPTLKAPTLQESGLDLEFANWRGLMARPDVSPAERRTLETLVADVVAAPRWKELVESKGWREAYLDSSAFAAFIKAEKNRMKAALKAAGFLKSGSD